PDRRLVHVHYFVEVLKACDPPMLTGDDLGAVDLRHQRRVKCVREQRRLPASAHAGYADETPDREPDVDVLQVVLARALKYEPVPAGRAPHPGHVDAPPS